MSTDTGSDAGYVVGVAWEKPEIAARVSLTYNSAITHDFTAIENIAPVPTAFKTEIPQSVNLEFQSGIAADTLLFGSIRWVDWSEFDITPAALLAASGASLVDYDDDTITYNIGVGRRFSDQWSGAVTVGYEPSTGGFSANLGPTDGFTSLGVAATYTHKRMEITGGARYIWVGDADTAAPAPFAPGTTLGEFTDNSGVAFGLKVAYNF
jgi:long-subunit fatty acid transport protein